MDILSADVQLWIVLVLVAGSAAYMARYGVRRLRQILSAADRADACRGCPRKCGDEPRPPQRVSLQTLGPTRDGRTAR